MDMKFYQLTSVQKFVGKTSHPSNISFIIEFNGKQARVHHNPDNTQVGITMIYGLHIYNDIPMIMCKWCCKTRT